MLHLLKSILLVILSPFKYIFDILCKKRFRKLFRSKSEENLTASPLNSNQVGQPQDHHVVNLEQNWDNDWAVEDTNSNAAKIQQYREQLYFSRQRSKTEEPVPEESKVNFFADMEPEKISQAKVFVGSNSANRQMSDRRNRLSFSASEQVPELSDPVRKVSPFLLENKKSRF